MRTPGELSSNVHSSLNLRALSVSYRDMLEGFAVSTHPERSGS